MDPPTPPTLSLPELCKEFALIRRGTVCPIHLAQACSSKQRGGFRRKQQVETNSRQNFESQLCNRE